MPSTDTITESEIWKPVIGFEELYEVSNKGQVRRIKKPRKYYLNENGYAFVCLCKKSKLHTKVIHRLVMEAFMGSRPSGMQINHIDGVKTHNWLENLEYVTPSQNQLHAVALGLHGSITHPHTTRGERSHRAKLKDVDVIEIRKLAKQGMTQRKIARLFSLKGHTTIGRILRGSGWSHVK